MREEVYRERLRDEPTIEVVGETTDGWGGVVSISVTHGALGSTLSLSPEEARELGVFLMDAATKAGK